MFGFIYTQNKRRQVRHANIEVLRRYVQLYKRKYPNKFLTLLELVDGYVLLEAMEAVW
jgi:hypothetical protein